MGISEEIVWRFSPNSWDLPGKRAGFSLVATWRSPKRNVHGYTWVLRDLDYVIDPEKYLLKVMLDAEYNISRKVLDL
jgi:hypothetical protein